MPVLERLSQIVTHLYDRCRPQRRQQDVHALRHSFRENYKKFRALLTANNNALELMAEMEQALNSGRPFGMTFVRSRCTALGVNVFKMIHKLQELSGGKYPGLIDSFNAVSGTVDEILGRLPPVIHGPVIVELREIDKGSADLVGEKMANLGEVRNRAGMPVPDGFVITASAAHLFLATGDLRDEINRQLTICHTDNLEELYTTSAAIQGLIARAPLPPELTERIQNAYQRLVAKSGKDILVAMRSSALGEDGGTASFAGQYRTRLDVGEDLLLATYKEIIAGKYKSQAIIYRLQRGFRHQDVTMCVGCLAMVDAKVGGVIYSRSPTDLRSPYLVINAAPGTAGQVVDGSIDTDLYHLNRESPHDMLLNEPRPGAGRPLLSGPLLRELAVAGVRLEAHFGRPQDIEWAIDHLDKLWILQSRPLGLMRAAGESAGDTNHERPETELLTGGVAASMGVACGPAFIVRSDLDLLRFPEGAILVVENALPDWATLLPRAAAVVSETGQVAAHLATVAREFAVPALFGAKGATSILTTGQIVTVDATAGRIHNGRHAALLDQPQPQPDLMKGSPVHRLLADVLRLVSPLHLTDPASLYFRPSSCETLHDLTRFCHEKAVSEMFSFGSRFHFAEKAAKQLVGKTPYQWWVIDLDHGFVDGYDHRQKFVHIDQIASSPMLALWEGMTAIAWQGPPPVSIKGFGSIIFQSTMNRELDPAVRSGLTTRNFFMISRNFCNLSVRLGYHFALVEAHQSDLLTENYVSFTFKGGAADQQRRFIRVQLLRDILQQFGFRIEQKVDALTARIEKKPADYLTSRLKILGYLLIHTRQIDMVMDDPAMVERYRRKIVTDIESILAPKAPTLEEEGP